MSRPKLTRPNSAILSTKADSLVPDINPITNARSMTHIDYLKDGDKIDNMHLIKKWSYLDNSNKSSPSLPDPAININMNETASNKMYLHAHKLKSAPVVEGNKRFFVFQRAVTKQNSVDSLINKLERDANEKTDFLMPNSRPIRNSQSMTQIHSIQNDKFKTVENRTYFDNCRKTSSDLSDSVTNIKMNESLLDKKNFSQCTPKSDSKTYENIRPFVASSLAAEQNSTDYLISKIEENTAAEIKFPAIVAINIQTSFVDDREGNERNLSSKNADGTQSIPEDNKETKVEECGNNENLLEDEKFFDIWNSHVERPLLPLKPLQKQRSLSCTNLVQTIKGFSRRRSGANNRFSSPENTLFESKEMCTSEANISNMTPRKISVESADQNFFRHPKTLEKSSESFTTKRERQSLQDYPWYHLVDAKEASKRLLRMHRNGAFLIRPASNPTNEVLHTLCVMCSGGVYNFHIKNMKDGRISLGRTWKSEHIGTFSSLLDMIKYHQTVPITINLAGQVGLVHLLITPPK